MDKNFDILFFDSKGGDKKLYLSFDGDDCSTTEISVVTTEPFSSSYNKTDGSLVVTVGNNGNGNTRSGTITIYINGNPCEEIKCIQKSAVCSCETLILTLKKAD